MNKFHKISLEQWIKDGGRESDWNDIELPVTKTKGSVGHDFVIPYDIEVEVGESFLVKSGIKCELDEYKALEIYPRSSFGIKKGMKIKNTVGIIDLDFFNNQNNEGHIMICVENCGKETLKIKKGEAFCQGLIKKCYIAEGSESENKRIGGIGSTSV